MILKLPLSLVFLAIIFAWAGWSQLSHAQCQPSQGCNATAFFIIPSSGDVLYDIATRFEVSDYRTLQTLNNISDVTNLVPGQSLRIPFHCLCGGNQLGRNFLYSVTTNDEDDTIASIKYGNLTTVNWMAADNPELDTNNLQPGMVLEIPVNCSCGDPQVSNDYGFFATYVVQSGDNLSTLSSDFSLQENLLRQYNPSVDFDNLQKYVTIIFLPVKDSSGVYPPFDSSVSPTAGGGGTDRGTILGAIVGGVAAFVVIVGCGVCFFRFKCSKKHAKLRNKDKEQSLLTMGQTITESSDEQGLTKQKGAIGMTSFKDSSYDYSTLPVGSIIEFSYEDLVRATDNFNVAKEIGRGGFAVVFCGILQGQKLAIKKMDIGETKGFTNEIKVLSSVHHTNLVRLIGYGTKGSLFLVYEYLENGTLGQHLRSGKNGAHVLSWEKRVQIAIDTARGIEYLHDHTTPTCIHRDIKPSNILLDMSFHAKVGDFGLAKFIGSDGKLMGITSSKQAGTYGYLAPEYATYGHISQKMDIYAFGVVLFQLVSGEEALLSAHDGPDGHYMDLVSVFEGVLNKPDAKEQFLFLVDPALGKNYPVESVWMMISLAQRCTRADPVLRPPMRDIAVDLVTLSHPDEVLGSQFLAGSNACSNFTIPS